MTDRELKRLSRIELIDIIYELQTRNEQNEAALAALQEQLDDRLLHISESGSIAEAALRVSGIFDAAQTAADQFLNSVHAANSGMEEKQAETDRVCAEKLAEAERCCSEKLRTAEQEAQRLVDAAAQKADALVREAEARAQTIVHDANLQSEEDWKRFNERADEFIRKHSALCTP